MNSKFGEKVRKKVGQSESSTDVIVMKTLLDLLNRVNDLEGQLQEVDSTIEVSQQSVDFGYEIHKRVLIRLLGQANLFTLEEVEAAYAEEENAVLGSEEEDYEEGDPPQEGAEEYPAADDVWEVVPAEAGSSPPPAYEDEKVGS